MHQQFEYEDRQLEAQGYSSAMPRRFSLSSLLSLSFALTATWNGFGSAIGTSLAESSSSGTLWTLVVAALMNLIVSVGTAELASAYPNSGAQYYWSYQVSSQQWAPFASYMSACISTCGWWLGLASVCNFVAAMVLAIVQLYVEDFVIQTRQQTLCYVLIVWLAVLLNIFAMDYLPTLNQYLLYFSVSTLLTTVFIILVAAFPNYRSSEWVFTDTTNLNGSYNKGFLLILCLLNNTYGFMGTDAGAHLAEEIPAPSANVPKVIVYPIIIGLLTAWPFAVACMYVITDVERVVNPPSGIALIEIYYQATGSKFLTTLLLAAFALCLFGCAVANITGSSRQIWAASRDNCYPWSVGLSQIHRKHQMPRNAACLTGVFTTLYGLIFLRSSTAFASMVSANIVFMMTSYVIPQGIVAWRGRSRVLPARHLDLGNWGLVINVTCCIWVIFLGIVACFPINRPVTAANMNYVGIVIIAITVYILLVWHLWQRHVFKGPTVTLHMMDQYVHPGLALQTKAVAYSRLGGHDKEAALAPLKDKDGKSD